MQLPLLSSAGLLHSPLPHLSPPLLSTVWCSFLSPLICSSPLRDAASSSPLRGASSPLICSSPLLYLSSTAWCSFLSSRALLHFSSPPSLSSAALHCVMQLPLLSSAAFLSSALHCMMQLPLLSSAGLLHSPLPHLSPPLLSTVWCSFLSPLICSSPLRDAASSSPLRGASSPLICSSPLLYLSSTAWCSFLSSRALLHFSSPPSLSSAALHCVMQLPLLSSAAFLSSALHCMMQLPLLCTSPPFLLSPISPPSISSPPSLLRCSPLREAFSPLSSAVLRSPLRDAASSPPLSSAAFLSSISWCSFLSSHLHLSISHLPHLSSAAFHCVKLPLLSHLQFSSSALHCAMQLPLLLPHLQLSYPPSLLSSI